ncbi:hypothetical protein [Paenibacillus lignilyticus]|uniref:Uncharacterized protein n=1 Tax=Paenibacillus lignilyticus TaxID=1172615 RepID=A0ABS5CAZ9_9BACL|nr:hypothetical protein [Paenibacillus lignilyticus]MBP3963161.1 hypothetical protein [Paenibacillus lignilyticus]
MEIVLILILPVILILFIINIDANVKKHLLNDERILERLDILIKAQQEKDKNNSE